ncbi:phosphotransferase [Streptomyces sp. NPDC001941]|uniref:phosphotransferase n=1 Tax=Streptomyces sp. NPDC001941 TaxID=3154659 RepID=UPI00332B573B
MSGQQRHREPVDVHLILRRDTREGPQVLLSRRAGDVYASGLWHLVSGHLDGPGEDVVTALVREAREEAGVLIDRADARFAVLVHHRGPGGRSRTGVFFEVRTWRGTPSIQEPDLCDAMGWFPLDALPEPMVAYCRAGLDTYLAGQMMAVHFQEPGDAVAYEPALDRRRPVEAVRTGPPVDAVRPEAEVRSFAEQAVGRIESWTDTSWAREGSRVWRVRGAGGGTWFVKVHHSGRFHHREVDAYRTWVPRLGAAAPRLVAADPALRAIVVTAVPGRSLHGAVHPPAEQQRVFRAIGRLAASIHHVGAPSGSGPAGNPLGKWQRHLQGARPHLAVGDEDFIRATLDRAAGLPSLPTVPTHGDFQLRNLLWDASSSCLSVIDFDRSEDGPAVRDFVRLADAWACRPDLHAAVMDGYGRALTPLEEQHVYALSLLDAVSGIQYGALHADPELLERGRRTLARLSATHHP